MKVILKKIAERNSVEISHMEVMPDQVQMVISFPPKSAPASIVKAFKGGS
jgi:putative transposase